MDNKKYAISIICEDKVGIVSRVAKEIESLSGNIEELYQSVLKGYFTITMLTTFSKGMSSETLLGTLEKLGGKNDFTATVLARKDSDIPPAAKGNLFVLTISGEDRPGIITKVTSYLADHMVNIEGFDSISSDGKFTTTATLTIPLNNDIKNMRLELSEILSTFGAKATLMHKDIFAATSNISM